MTTFFPLKLKPFNSSECLCTYVGVVVKANPLDFPVFSHLISSKWVLCLRYLVVFKPKGEYRSSWVTSLLKFPINSVFFDYCFWCGCSCRFCNIGCCYPFWYFSVSRLCLQFVRWDYCWYCWHYSGWHSSFWKETVGLFC